MHNTYNYYLNSVSYRQRNTLSFPLVIIAIMFRGTVTFIRRANPNPACESVGLLNGTAVAG